MRKWNGILTAAILLLFLIHGILGAFQLTGLGNDARKGLAWAAVALTAVHAVIGGKYTLDTLRAMRRAGRFYFRENLLFWVRRISGLAVLVLLAFHMTAFSAGSSGAYRLKWFSTGKLICQLLLALALGVHILSNLRPLWISFGSPALRRWTADALAVLAILLLFMAAGFVIYYLRWNVW